VLGLAGPSRKIAAIMPCTVIEPNDMADRILDRSRNPMWQGERMSMMPALPTDMTLWNRYKELSDDSYRRGGRGEEATAFYLANQARMDAGAVVSWQKRHNDDELSAVQHAMNLLLRDEHSFWSEYQNQPKPRTESPGRILREWITGHNSGRPRYTVQSDALILTTHFDVQKELIFWMTCAWTQHFTGQVIDYGCFPNQNRKYYTLGDAQRTLSRQYKGRSMEGRIFAALMEASGHVLGREYQREDGTTMRVSLALVDAAWGESTETVYQFCRVSPYSNVLMPAFGKFFGASSIPMSNYKTKPGERTGLNWRIPSPIKRRLRHVVYDTNFWKSFVRTRLATPMGDRGALSFWKEDNYDHRLVADHCCAELPIPVTGQGREVEEWKILPTRPDNHHWDNLVGCAVAASMQGAAFTSITGSVNVKRSKPKQKSRRVTALRI